MGRFQNSFFKARECKDCGPLPENHWHNFLDDPVNLVLRRYIKLPGGIAHVCEKCITNIFERLGLISFVCDVEPGAVSLRTTVFTDEGKKRGWDFRYAKGPAGYLNDFYMTIGEKNYLCEGLPRAEWLATHETESIDDKAAVKEKLLSLSFPAPLGKAFWFWQKKTAFQYGLNLGFPLVVKPRSGSMSHHVTVNITDDVSLARAIDCACRYSPAFMVEKFLPNVRMFRATVIDGENIACVERVPAHVTGDGKHSVKELLEIKNNDPLRGRPRQKDTTLFKIVVNDITSKLLTQQNYKWDSVPKKGRRVYLQEKVILDLGADLFERTKGVHKENAKLFRAVAQAFHTKLVGIDFLAEDITKQWQNQTAAIIELNSLPYIDMHHFPTEGEPVNVAGFICDMVEKYYK